MNVKTGCIETPGYRWKLWRIWGPGPIALVVMLNPSTAGAEKDDPTTRNLIALLQALGFGGYFVGNLFPCRSSKPSDISAWLSASEQVGALRFNAECVAEMAMLSDSIILAWGQSGPPVMRRAADRMVDTLRPFVKPLCFGHTASGAPIHPAARGKARLVPGAPLVAWTGYLPGRHRWGEPNRVDHTRTERPCLICGLKKITRHEPGEDWTEFESHGLVIARTGDGTPPCDPGERP